MVVWIPLGEKNSPLLDAKFSRRVRQLGDFSHIFPGITGLVRVVKGMLVPEDARSRLFHREGTGDTRAMVTFALPPRW